MSLRGGFADEQIGSAYTLMGTWGLSGAERVALISRAHLKALKRMEMRVTTPGGMRKLHDVQAHYGAVLGRALVDSEDRYGEADIVLDEAGYHAVEAENDQLMAHLAGTRALLQMYRKRYDAGLEAITIGMPHAHQLAAARLYGLRGRILARKGEMFAKDADRAFRAAQSTLERYDGLEVDPVPFSGISHAELAQYASDGYARLGMRKMTEAVIAYWLPLADARRWTTTAVTLRASRGIAYAGHDPAVGAAMMTEALGMAARQGPLTTGVKERAWKFAAVAPGPHGREVIEMLKAASA